MQPVGHAYNFVCDASTAARLGCAFLTVLSVTGTSFNVLQLNSLGVAGVFPNPRSPSRAIVPDIESRTDDTISCKELWIARLLALQPCSWDPKIISLQLVQCHSNSHIFAKYTVCERLEGLARLRDYLPWCLRSGMFFLFCLIILYSLYSEYDSPLVPSASGLAG